MSRLVNVKIQYTKKVCNSLAHSIVKLTLNKLEPDVRLGQYPTELMYLFSNLND